MARRKRKQSVLKRGSDGNVIYDAKGRPVVKRVITARASNFKKPARSASGGVTTRQMTPEERERYGIPSNPVDQDERKRIGEAIPCLTYYERRLHDHEK